MNISIINMDTEDEIRIRGEVQTIPPHRIRIRPGGQGARAKMLSFLRKSSLPDIRVLVNKRAFMLDAEVTF